MVAKLYSHCVCLLLYFGLINWTVYCSNKNTVSLNRINNRSLVWRKWELLTNQTEEAQRSTSPSCEHNREADPGSKTALNMRNGKRKREVLTQLSHGSQGLEAFLRISKYMQITDCWTSTLMFACLMVSLGCKFTCFWQRESKFKQLPG